MSGASAGLQQSALLGALRRAVRDAARPAEPGESVKAAIGRAARRLGLGYARARQHWYGQARSVPAEEWIRVQEAALRLRRERAQALRAELAALEGCDGGLDAAPPGGGGPVGRGPGA